MNSAEVTLLLGQLDDEIDDLETAINPLISTSFAESAPKLPLLDKAMLCTLGTYAIESILFSYLRLNGVNAREHLVFEELARVKQYFDKIRHAEFPPEKDTMHKLDKNAAARFIKAGLSGNSKHEMERAEQQAKERARAQIVTARLAKKRVFEQVEVAGDACVKSNLDALSTDQRQDDETKLKTQKRRKVEIFSAQGATLASTEVPQSRQDYNKETSNKKKKSSEKRNRKRRRAQERRERSGAKEAANGSGG